MADYAKVGQVCAAVGFGRPYVLTEADWLSVPVEVINAREETDLRDGVIDLTQPGEPIIYPGYTRHEFRTLIAGADLAYSFDANDDGREEVYIEFDRVTTCSNGVVQCRFLVLDASTPRKPLMDAPGHCLALGDASRNGWRDLVVIALQSDYSITSDTYAFDGTRYVEAVRTIFRPSPLEE